MNTIKSICRVILLAGMATISAGREGLAQDQTSQPSVLWIGDAHGDIYRASVIKQRPTSREPENYAVLLDAKRLDPFQMHRNTEGLNPNDYFDRIMLLVELPPDSSGLDYQLSVTIDKGVPVCTSCDGGCFRLKERRTQTITADLTSGETARRYLINLNDFVGDWHLVDVAVNATLSLTGKQILRSTIHAEEWPWCL